MPERRVRESEAYEVRNGVPSYARAEDGESPDTRTGQRRVDGDRHEIEQLRRYCIESIFTRIIHAIRREPVAGGAYTCHRVRCNVAVPHTHDGEPALPAPTTDQAGAGAGVDQRRMVEIVGSACCTEGGTIKNNVDACCIEGIADAVLAAKDAEVERAVAREREALDESVKLQSHYAELLNMNDGGQRLTFKSTREWLDRLDSIRARPR